MPSAPPRPVVLHASRPVATAAEIARPRTADPTCARSYAKRERRRACSERVMARPPGCAQAGEGALEALAKRRGRERAAQLVVVEQRGRDHVAIARRQRLERRE